MPWPLLLIAWLGWATTFAAAVRLAQSAQKTTLITAVRWFWASSLFYAVSLALLSMPQVPQVIAQQSFYWTGIVALCPLIAVLGAQRPGVRVWNSFILIPLILVLGWPALTVWFSGFPPAPLQIEAPMALGFAVVAVMGLGNYILIPRWTLAVLGYGAAIACTILPLTTLVNLSPIWHLAAYPCLGFAILVGWLSAFRAETHSDPLQQLWCSFRDRFGLVWAARIRDRVNAAAEQEKWCWRLEMDGFRPIEAPDAMSESDTRARADHTMRWLLRRFLDVGVAAPGSGTARD